MKYKEEGNVEQSEMKLDPQSLNYSRQVVFSAAHILNISYNQCQDSLLLIRRMRGRVMNAG